MNLLRCLLLFTTLLVVGARTAEPAAIAPTASMPSLWRTGQKSFHLGVGISDRIAFQKEDHALLRHHFDTLTPENCMKPAQLQAAQGQYDFRLADSFVNFATTNGLRVVGHCLVWAKDDRTPEWFFKDAGAPVSKDVLLQRMREHIRTVVGRYKGRIREWDVVNEALDDGDKEMRPSGWLSACGEDFIAEAFRAAHETDPKALLIYNDYNNELPGKREKMLRLLQRLLDQKVPIHAVGMQGHYELDKVPFAEIDKTLTALKDMGLQVVVSELNIDVIPRSRWWADNGKHRQEMAKLSPYKDGCPPEILERQAQQYAELFRIFRKHSDLILRLSFWNLHDGQSWLNYFPWERVNHPLLFDRQRQPKPAFQEVIKTLEAK